LKLARDKLKEENERLKREKKYYRQNAWIANNSMQIKYTSMFKEQSKI
jgi:hypothetical protein